MEEKRVGLTAPHGGIDVTFAVEKTLQIFNRIALLVFRDELPNWLILGPTTSLQGAIKVVEHLENDFFRGSPCGGGCGAGAAVGETPQPFGKLLERLLIEIVEGFGCERLEVDPVKHLIEKLRLLGQALSQIV